MGAAKGIMGDGDVEDGRARMHGAEESRERRSGHQTSGS